MAWETEIAFVRDFIVSGFTNPTEKQFRAEVRKWKPEILQEGIKKCDQLRANFIHTQGPNAPGIKLCDRAKQILQKP
jgi:hypothetical protein